MFEHALRSGSSSQALTVCSQKYHVNHWRSRIIDTPRIRRVRGHRIPEYQRAPRQQDKLQRDYDLLSRLPFYKSGSYCYEDPKEYSHILSSNLQEGDHLGLVRTQRFAQAASCGREPEA